MKYIGYCRVSTEDQGKDGISLDLQSNQIERYCELYKLTLVDTYQEIGSAKSLERPKLQLILDNFNNYDGLIVYKLDRLSRNIVDFGFLISNYFDKKELIAVVEQIDTRTASGRLNLNLLMSVAQWEREVISERTRSALNRKKELGDYLGRVPYGYKLENKIVVTNDQEQLVITKIKKLRKSKSYSQIAQILNNSQVPTRSGKAWTRSMVANISNLSNK